jgi:hypothetical protein
MESLLGEEQVWTGQTRIRAKKGHNFWSDCWMTLKYFQEFSKAFFLGVTSDLLLSE